MSTGSEIATELAGILQVHQEDIIASWMDSVQGLPGFHHAPGTPDELSSLARRGLRFMHQALVADSYASASQDFDMQALHLPLSALRPGEISDAVWLIRAAMLPHIQQHAPTPSRAWEWSSQLDQTLRWISSRLADLCAAEERRHALTEQTQMTRLLTLIQSTGATLKLDEILFRMAEGIISVTGASHCDILWVDEIHGTVRPRFEEMDPVIHATISKLGIEFTSDVSIDSIGNGFLQQVITEKKPRVFYGLSCAPCPSPAEAELKPLLVVPIVAGKHMLALALGISDDSQYIYAERELELAHDLATSAGLAIHHPRLYAERASLAVQNESIMRVTDAVLQGRDLNQVFRIVCEEAKHLIGAIRASIYLLGTDGWLQHIHCTDVALKPERLSPLNCPNGIAMRERRTILLTPGKNPGGDSHSDVEQTNLLIVPLLVRDGAIGTVDVAMPAGDVADDDMHIVGLFASQAAIAIENARLHQQVRSLATLQERDRLAREMHDNVAQALSTVKLKASYASELLRSGEATPALDQLRDLEHIVTEAHADVREAIFSLRTNILSDTEFLPALQKYLERYSASYGIDAQLVVAAGLSLVMPPESITQITRIIHEGLTNVRKHAGAQTVRVQVEWRDDMWCFIVEDDGQGFDLGQLAQRDERGFGLQVMRERAESLRGCLEIRAEPGQGTRIVTRVPVPEGH